MKIRDYKTDDENQWLRCRVLSFLDCSYYNDVMIKRPFYEGDAICLVAEENDTIIGLIDVEIEGEPKSLCVAGAQRGAVIWNLAVLPEFRREHLATALWMEAKKRLVQKGIDYCEVWTQEDEAANCWYLAQGFCNIKERNWLRCYAHPSKADWFLKRENIGKIYGVEEMIFETAPERRNEISEYCYRMDEVRLYAIRF